ACPPSEHVDGRSDVHECKYPLRLARRQAHTPVRGGIVRHVRILVHRYPADEVRGVWHPDAEWPRPGESFLSVDVKGSRRRSAERTRGRVHGATHFVPVDQQEDTTLAIDL